MLAEIALREGQSTNPLFRVHRWFARRLGSQFRGILTALSLKDDEEDLFWCRYFGRISLGDAVVLDPFVGGGTILVEASRCDARLIGYDIDPIATFITRFELGASAFNGIPRTVKAACDGVSSRIRSMHRTSLQDGSEVDVLHHFWVERGGCPDCGHVFDLHPHHQLGHNPDRKIQWVFCGKCDEVHELPLKRAELSCSCDARTKIRRGPLRDGRVVCPSCRTEHALADVVRTGGDSRWRLFAQEYLIPGPYRLVRLFKAATDQDRRRYEDAAASLRIFEKRYPAFIPGRSIPAEGRSDQRPLIHGFGRYRDLFNDRQLLHLALLGRTVSEIGDGAAKRLMAAAFSEHLATNCMYASYAFGYRRLCPLFSIHSYRHITRPVEVNPWAIGRGTYPNALNKIRKAIAFAKAPSDMDPAGGRRPSATSIGTGGPADTAPEKVIRGTARAAIKTKSSVDLAELPDGSVDLVLTDPPYFDNVSYSEMSDFYLVWHQALGIAESPYDDPRRHAPLTTSLTVNPRMRDSVDRYRMDMERVFRELHRVLKPRGVCVFTYHHGSAEAWTALGEALVRSGFRCANVLPMRGEGQGGLHSFEGTIKWDAVLVCRKGRRRHSGEETKDVVTTRAAMEKAKVELARHVESLSGNPAVGFREPDQVNLFRGLLVAAATLGKAGPEKILLSEALGYNSGGLPSDSNATTPKDPPVRGMKG
jgi:adenine-specific DNA methylase